MKPEFEEHFQKVIQLEGGFRLIKNPTEETHTYAGIYRKIYPQWEGWKYIDKGETPPTELVRKFYYENFYQPLEGIENPEIRFSIFEFGVNAGLRKAIKIAQAVVGTSPDGILGPKTLAALNTVVPEDFIKSYLIARIKHYLDLANADPRKYGVYLRGWLNRAFKGVNV
ncbi:MAG: putative peptidoglycan-binding domain-containing protein [Thermodesulforhabdaceae bacterium]